MKKIKFFLKKKNFVFFNIKIIFIRLETTKNNFVFNISIISLKISIFFEILINNFYFLVFLIFNTI